MTEKELDNLKRCADDAICYRSALESVRSRLAGIAPSDLTTAETQILKIVAKALEAQQ